MRTVRRIAVMALALVPALLAPTSISPAGADETRSSSVQAMTEAHPAPQASDAIPLTPGVTPDGGGCRDVYDAHYTSPHHIRNTYLDEWRCPIQLRSGTASWGYHHIYSAHGPLPSVFDSLTQAALTYKDGGKCVDPKGGLRYQTYYTRSGNDYTWRVVVSFVDDGYGPRGIITAHERGGHVTC